MLHNAGHILKIKVLDHVIIGKNGFTSLKEKKISSGQPVSMTYAWSHPGTCYVMVKAR